MASTREPGASSTLTGLLPQLTTKLENGLGTTEYSYVFGYQMDRQEEEGFYSPEGFPPLHVTKQEIRMGYPRFRVRINQI